MTLPPPISMDSESQDSSPGSQARGSVGTDIGRGRAASNGQPASTANESGDGGEHRSVSPSPSTSTSTARIPIPLADAGSLAAGSESPETDVSAFSSSGGTTIPQAEQTIGLALITDSAPMDDGMADAAARSPTTNTASSPPHGAKAGDDSIPASDAASASTSASAPAASSTSIITSDSPSTIADVPPTLPPAASPEPRPAAPAPPARASRVRHLSTPSGYQLSSPPRMGLSELLSSSPTPRGEADSYFSSVNARGSEGGSSGSAFYSPALSLSGASHAFSLSLTSASASGYGSGSGRSRRTATTPDTSRSPSGASGGTGTGEAPGEGQRVRSPKVQNTGNILAPHGTFTSAGSASRQRARDATSTTGAPSGGRGPSTGISRPASDGAVTESAHYWGYRDDVRGVGRRMIMHPNLALSPHQASGPSYGPRLGPSASPGASPGSSAHPSPQPGTSSTAGAAPESMPSEDGETVHGPARSAEEMALIKAAHSGDQLAMYHLGWRTEFGRHKHTLGSVQDVWGPTDLAPSTSFRSSDSSRTAFSSPAAPLDSSFLGPRSVRSPSLTSALPGPSPPAASASTSASSSRTTSKGKVATAEHKARAHVSDLFDDAARLTLSSNADENVRRVHAAPRTSPPPRPPLQAQVQTPSFASAGKKVRSLHRKPNPNLIIE